MLYVKNQKKKKITSQGVHLNPLNTMCRSHCLRTTDEGEAVGRGHRRLTDWRS